MTKTFKQFLDEEGARDTKGAVKGTPEEIAQILRDKCGKFIAGYRKSGPKVLYRGISGVGREGPLCVYSPIRTDRRPVDMESDRHELISAAMEKLNMPTRKNGLFVTASKGIASGWGSLYIVFLEDGWQGVVFENVGHDDYAYSSFSDYAGWAIRSEQRGRSGENAMDMMVEFIDNQGAFVFDDAQGLAKVIGDRYIDIIMKGKGYYAMRVGAEDTRAVLEILGIE